MARMFVFKITVIWEVHIKCLNSAIPQRAENRNRKVIIVVLRLLKPHGPSVMKLSV